jgi:DnaK suppressor protein
VTNASQIAAELAAAHASVADLNQELAAVAESTASVPDDEHDSEGSTIGYKRARVTALLAQAQRRIAALEMASERIEAGTYQRCEDCGSDIGSERLEALPATRICAVCARRAG